MEDAEPEPEVELEEEMIEPRPLRARRDDSGGVPARLP
jgi:hypothetical protein